MAGAGYGDALAQPEAESKERFETIQTTLDAITPVGSPAGSLDGHATPGAPAPRPPAWSSPVPAFPTLNSGGSPGGSGGTYTGSSSNTFDRAVDFTVLKFSSRALFTRVECGRIFRVLLGDAGSHADTPFEVEGIPTNTTFAATFAGDELTAARRVRRVLDGQKTGKIEWRQRYIKSTENDGNGNPKESLLFTNVDKNLKTIRTEIGCRNVFNLLRDSHVCHVSH